MDDFVAVLFGIIGVLAVLLLANKGYKMVTCPVCGDWMEAITMEGVKNKLEEHGVSLEDRHRLESVYGTKCPNGCWISMSIVFREKDTPSHEDNDNEWYVRRNEREGRG